VLTFIPHYSIVVSASIYNGIVKACVVKGCASGIVKACVVKGCASGYKGVACGIACGVGCGIACEACTHVGIALYSCWHCFPPLLVDLSS